MGERVLTSRAVQGWTQTSHGLAALTAHSICKKKKTCKNTDTRTHYFTVCNSKVLQWQSVTLAEVVVALYSL